MKISSFSAQKASDLHDPPPPQKKKGTFIIHRQNPWNKGTGYLFWGKSSVKRRQFLMVFSHVDFLKGVIA